jgi:hypothetical protein
LKAKRTEKSIYLVSFSDIGNYVTSSSLIPWSTVILDEMTGPQISKKLAADSGSEVSTVVFK